MSRVNEIVSEIMVTGRALYQSFRNKGGPYAKKLLALPNDSLEKTISVALALCVVCAILVSGSAVALKSIQQDNKARDIKKNILSVVGLMQEGVDIDQAFSRIEQKIVNLDSGEYDETIDPATYDQRKAAKDPAMNLKIEKGDDIAGIHKRARLAKVYLLRNGDRIEKIVLPVHGYGLWSTLYGFLALEGDGQTVVGINFYDQAETPGLGGEVVNPRWRALWPGKKIYDESGTSVIGLVKGVVDRSKLGSEYKVDGLAGATLTSNGVTNLLRYWTGKQGFSLYLQKIRNQRG
jgi:Na+-transporting NADH:ubiquinone oxidoreductase subunit C